MDDASLRLIKSKASMLTEEVRPYSLWFGQMLLFAEGTRFTKDKHEASMKFAAERGLPQLKRHLIPRTRGFIQCAQSLSGHFPVIYDVTVSFNTSVVITCSWIMWKIEWRFFLTRLNEKLLRVHLVFSLDSLLFCILITVHSCSDLDHWR